VPKGPRGEKRPADAIGRAVKIAKIATGEVEDERDEELSSAAAEMGRKGGKKRAESMTPERRKEIARKAAATRWAKKA
jgi:Sec-independent protein translocase protein TatA